MDNKVLNWNYVYALLQMKQQLEHFSINNKLCLDVTKKVSSINCIEIVTRG